MKMCFIVPIFLIWRLGGMPFGQTITLDGSGTGRTFDGIGTLSAGASSRLLIDYPEPQRSQILDYLFLPNYGASMQILKVEIGSGVNSTDGSEPCHEPEKGVENYHRGYEWWLMQHAKIRNPNIKLWGLQWGAPGWIGKGNFWSTDNIGHLVRWAQHAKKDHGLTIDYLGGWNERSPAAQNLNWFTQFRQALNDSGLSSIKIVSDEGFAWSVATDMENNPAYFNAVDIAGSHYSCGWLSTSFTACPTSTVAMNLGKPLWSSEDGSQDYHTGALAMARALNHNYIDGRMTASINWSTIWSALPGLPFNGDGLLMAQSPWSGNYEVGKSVWVQAHHTQFVKPGWKYLDVACGYYGGNQNNGSYVTLKNPNSTDYSIITETENATVSRTVTFQLAGGLSTGALHVWKSSLNANNLVLAKTATASSQLDVNYSAAMAIDGKPGTRWNSVAGDTLGAWLQVDLGTPMDFNTVVSKETAGMVRVATYKIQFSNNGSAWNDLINGTTLGSSKTDAFARVTARYIRILILRSMDTPSLDEFEIYNEPKNLESYFVRQPDIIPVGNAFNLALEPGSLYSLTTTTGQAKGNAGTPPMNAIFPIPYYDNFERYGGMSKTPLYFSDWDGTFETVACGGGRAGTCLGQIIKNPGINWNGIRHPWTLIGDAKWTNYQVDADFLQPQSGYVQIFGRLSGIGGTWSLTGYFLQISNTGAWLLFRRASNEMETNLDSGTVQNFQASAWHQMRLVCSGANIEAWIDGIRVGSVTDNTYPVGMVGLGTFAGVTAQFDNFSVTPPGTVSGNPYSVQKGLMPSRRAVRKKSGEIRFYPTGLPSQGTDTRGRLGKPE